ncbi:hypothetical protein AWV79_33750 [Cupriavidus sp. UYMMa02A]|nr:hypothetical protein AWV79_33750 [Cupriavidus sp. UYMMa02A]
MGTPFHESSTSCIVLLSMLAQAPGKAMAKAAAAAGAKRKMAARQARRTRGGRHEAGMGDSATAFQGARPLSKG